jgi:hypothetical protein
VTRRPGNAKPEFVKQHLESVAAASSAPAAAPCCCCCCCCRSVSCSYCRCCCAISGRARAAPDHACRSAGAAPRPRRPCRPRHRRGHHEGVGAFEFYNFLFVESKTTTNKKIIARTSKSAAKRRCWRRQSVSAASRFVSSSNEGLFITKHNIGGRAAHYWARGAQAPVRPSPRRPARCVLHPTQYTVLHLHCSVPLPHSIDPTPSPRIASQRT